MASQTTTPPPVHDPQTVGNAFVVQYYHVLHQSPEQVYKFYQDSSVISRPEPNGAMSSVTTMQAINDKILSMDYQDFKAEIKTADAQDSSQNGVIVLVTGCLTGKDNVRRKFAQTFFLSGQNPRYFVLNDVFRYVDDDEEEINAIGIESSTVVNAPRGSQTPDAESSPVSDHLDPRTPVSEEDLNNGAEVCDPSDVEEGSVIVDEAQVDTTTLMVQADVQPIPEIVAPSEPEDAPKKSYASILKVKAAPKPATVYVPKTVTAVAPPKVDQQVVVAATPALLPSSAGPGADGNAESSSLQEEAESHSIYIRNLPINATPYQLEEEFRRFGPIKPRGIQVKSNKQQGFCFGFVEFESSSSMKDAIEASPITIGGQKAHIEEKRATTRASTGSGGSRGRFPPGRGGAGFRNENFRGHGGFGGGRGGGYGRNDYGGYRGDYRGRGPSGRSGDAYQRVDQNGNGKTDRTSTQPTSVSPS